MRAFYLASVSGGTPLNLVSLGVTNRQCQEAPLSGLPRCSKADIWEEPGA